MSHICPDGFMYVYKPDHKHDNVCAMIDYLFEIHR